MRKKETWMKKGAIVLANSKPAVISKMQENQIDGVDYVYYIWVKIDGKVNGPYHPSDITELKS